MHGGYGYTRDFPVEQFWRDNRLNAIHEGTHGIQAADLLGRKIVANEAAALRALDARVTATLATAHERPALAADAARVESAWRQVLAVTQRLSAVADPARRLANASSYLEAFGHALVGWLWLEQALVADRALAAATARSPEETAFLEGKRQAFRWFARWELPKVGGWLGVLDPVDPTVLEMRAEWF